MLTLAATDPMAVVTMISTILLAVLTGAYVSLTHRLVMANIDPCVIVTVQKDLDKSGDLLLVIENIGKGVARDIRFELSGPIPHQAFGSHSVPIPYENPQIEETMDSGPLIEGIPALGPGGKRQIIWGHFWGLYRAIGDKKITVKCHFKRAAGHFAFSERDCEPVECALDVHSFIGEDVADKNWPRQIAKQLEELNQTIKSR